MRDLAKNLANDILNMLWKIATQALITKAIAGLGGLFGGGIMTPEQAAELLSSGASLIQLHTGLLYRGPKLVKKINQYLVKH